MGSRGPEGLGITEEATGNMAETLLMNLTKALKFGEVNLCSLTSKSHSFLANDKPDSTVPPDQSSGSRGSESFDNLAVDYSLA